MDKRVQFDFEIEFANWGGPELSSTFLPHSLFGQR